MPNPFTSNPYTQANQQPAMPQASQTAQNSPPTGKKFDYITAKKNGVSDQEIFNYLQQQKSKGVDIYIDKNDFQQAQTETKPDQNSQTSQTSQPEKKGFWSGLADAAIRPFAELGVSAVNAKNNAGEVLFGQRDKNGMIADHSNETANLPFLGETKPAFTGQENLPQAAGKMLSYGANIGSWFIGGGEAKALGQGALQASKEIVGQVAKDVIKGKIIPASLKAAKEFAPVGAASGLGQGLQNVSSDKSLGQNIAEVAGNTALGTVTAAGGAALFSGLFAGGGKAIQKVIEHYAPIEEKANTAVVEAIDNAVKPSVSNVNTPKLKANYYDKAIKAFETINKYKTAFPDESGNMVDRNPKTVSELFDAIGQAKKQIFNTYDQVAQKSGEMGAKFNAEPTISKLETVVNDIGKSPETRQYAREQISAIQELHGASPSQVQTRIEELNKGLGSFYDGRVSKARADVDASVAYSLRQDLENLINNSTGQNYQYFKNEYGSLSTIEKDIGRSAINQAKKASQGGLGFTDIFTGGDITSGIISMNPALIAKGLAGRGIKEIYKTLNNPDRYIKAAFDLLDKIPPEYAPLVEQSQKLLPQGKAYPKASVNTPIRLTSKLNSNKVETIAGTVIPKK